MIFNINDCIKIKITDYGFEILEEQHQELIDRVPMYNVPFEEVKPKVDSEGWTRMQMWEVFEIFGPYMGMGQKPAIEIDIMIPLEEQI